MSDCCKRSFLSPANHPPLRFLSHIYFSRYHANEGLACRLANGLHILRFKIRNLTLLIFFNVFIIFIIIYFVKKWRSLKEGTSYYHNGDFLIHKIVNAFWSLGLLRLFYSEKGVHLSTATIKRTRRKPCWKNGALVIVKRSKKVSMSPTSPSFSSLYQATINW